MGKGNEHLSGLAAPACKSVSAGQPRRAWLVVLVWFIWFLWLAGGFGVFRSSNQTNEINKRNQLHEIAQLDQTTKTDVPERLTDFYRVLVRIRDVPELNGKDMTSGCGEVGNMLQDMVSSPYTPQKHVAKNVE